MPRLMKAPEGTSSFNVKGHGEVQVPANGIVTVDDSIVEELKSHGFALYTEPKDGPAVDGDARRAIESLGERVERLGENLAKSTEERIEGLRTEFAEKERKDLFALLKAIGVGATATLKTDELRELLVQETAKREQAAADAAGKGANDGVAKVEEPAKPTEPAKAEPAKPE